MPAHSDSHVHNDIIYPGAIPFILVHLACLAAIWTGVTANTLLLCAGLFVVRMFGVSAGYHRYFSHRAFKTSRVGQFVLAWLAQSSAQRGVLWWSAVHRHHHRHSDTELDVHSPRQRGFWHAHVGWVFEPQDDDAAREAVPDLAAFPELRWLTKHQYIPAIALAVGAWLTMGWGGLVVGFFWSTVILYHVTFMINSLAHVHGTKRYVTGDDSRNNWWLAIVTLGEGWHNNHHAHMASTRQGFRWWEIDVTFYVLTMLSWIGVVWDLNAPPRAVVNNTKPLARGLLESVSRQIAASYPVAHIADRTHDAWDAARHEPLGWANQPTEAEIRARAVRPVPATLTPCTLHLPHVPTLDDVRHRTTRMVAATAATDAIAWHARDTIVTQVCASLVHRWATP